MVNGKSNATNISFLIWRVFQEDSHYVFLLNFEPIEFNNCKTKSNLV